MPPVIFGAKGWVLEIIWLECVDSTQHTLIEALKTQTLVPPVALGADRQEKGVGSRNNRWIGEPGNFFGSVALPMAQLPEDLKIESASIYFAYHMKMVLAAAGSSVWLKWPNDFYVGGQKIGGCITSKIKDVLVCGIGINIQVAPQGFGTLDCTISPKALMEGFVTQLAKRMTWKQTFSYFQIEFSKSKSYTSHTSTYKFNLKDATLVEDGSLLVNGERVFSSR